LEKSYFFDSTSDDQRIYQAADFARFHAQIIGNGVSNTANLPDLEVTAKTNMDVALGAGYMFANGYMYENDSTMTLKHVIADPVNDRIDRVVIRFDNNPAERRIYAYIKQGVPAKSPTPPALQRDNYIYEMSVAQVRIKAGKSFIEQSQITDERANDAVCGYIPLHNIYRGLQINEDGIVNLLNQSYVESDGNINFNVSDREVVNFPFSSVLKVDKQKEVKNNRFIPKFDGVYFIFGYIAFDEGVLPTQADVQLSLRINGEYSTIFAARTASGKKDNIFVGSTVETIKAGSTVEIAVFIQNLESDVQARNIRVRIVKTA
jgi:hypothetical protein